jgi:hypothetical protein
MEIKRKVERFCRWEEGGRVKEGDGLSMGIDVSVLERTEHIERIEKRGNVLSSITARP